MYLILKFTINLLSLLSWRSLQKLGAFLGSVGWYLLRTRRKVAIINAKIIGCKDAELVAKESFKNTFMSYLEAIYIKRIDYKFIDKYVIVKGQENFNEVKNNKYALISAHIGAWDLVPPVFTLCENFKALVVGRQASNPALNKIIIDARTSDRVVYMTQDGFIKQASKFEEQGYVTGSLLDHSTTQSDSVTSEFFGLKVRTTAGVSALCVRKKMPMVPCFFIREGNKLILYIEPPIYPDESLKPKLRIIDLCNRMNKVFESIITRYPEQWYLLHKRFKKVQTDQGVINMYEK